MPSNWVSSSPRIWVNIATSQCIEILKPASRWYMCFGTKLITSSWQIDWSFRKYYEHCKKSNIAQTRTNRCNIQIPFIPTANINLNHKNKTKWGHTLHLQKNWPLYVMPSNFASAGLRCSWTAGVPGRWVSWVVHIQCREFLGNTKNVDKKKHGEVGPWDGKYNYLVGGFNPFEKKLVK